jgi:peptidoglycan-associated lipoprotein
MRMHALTAVVVGLAVVGTTGCATKGYVSRVVDERSQVVDERTRAVEKRVADVERVAQDAAVSSGRNADHIREVDQTATGAHETANAAATASRLAQVRANDASAVSEALEADAKRLLFEVTMAEDHGHFSFDAAVLPDPVSEGLDELVDRVRSLDKPAHLEIEGHTDATGPTDYNARLALERAEAVRRYLHEQHRLPLHKISVISYGEEKPIAPNDTVDGRAMNRRVVVRVLG